MTSEDGRNVDGGPAAEHPPIRSRLRRRSFLIAAGLVGAGAAAFPALKGAADTFLSDSGLDLPPLYRRCRFGAWAGGDSDLVTNHRTLERRLGARLPLFSWFQAWEGGWNQNVASQIAGLSTSPAYDCVVAWEAWNVNFRDIMSGAHDARLHDFFSQSRSYPGSVTVRLFHEMNGNWYPWTVASSTSNVASVDDWIRGWRHVVDAARAAGAINTRFMFCANMNDVGGIPVERYWPGEEYVDLIGLDGYNWGWNGDGTPLVSAQALIGPMYARLTSLHRTAPFEIGEIGCAENPGKAQWLENLYRSRDFPRLGGLLFFSEKKEQDWRLDSNQRCLEVSRCYLTESAPA